MELLLQDIEPPEITGEVQCDNAADTKVAAILDVKPCCICSF